MRAVLHVFIDTNIYLSFYSLAADDLEELRKLLVAIQSGEVKLWTTQQGNDEFKRNREGKISQSLDWFRKLKPAEGIPQMVRNLPEFQAFLEARREFGTQLNSLDQQLAGEIATESLAADQILRELMAAAEEVEVTDEIFTAAQRRVAVGNPPGKPGSLGDAIHWECLLSEGGAGDLYVLSDDEDFASKLDRDVISAFLKSEWRELQDGDVHLYRRISSFFRDKFPNIELASELEKEIRIQRLINSSSFEATHSAISQLSSYSEFTDSQARDLLQGALNNSQINWIARDPDVRGFFGDLVDAHADLLEAGDARRFEDRFELDLASAGEGADSASG